MKGARIVTFTDILFKVHLFKFKVSNDTEMYFNYEGSEVRRVSYQQVAERLAKHLPTLCYVFLKIKLGYFCRGGRAFK